MYDDKYDDDDDNFDILQCWLTPLIFLELDEVAGGGGGGGVWGIYALPWPIVDDIDSRVKICSSTTACRQRTDGMQSLFVWHIVKWHSTETLKH